MKSNPLRAGVERGELQIGTWVNMLRNPASLTMFKQAGLDFVRLDMEHSSPSIETVADFAAMGRALDLPVMVRPPEANREWITRLLDVGIYNLHCPQVDTPEHAAEIVAASYYTPRGSRGMSGASPGNDYDMTMPVMERLKFTNDQVFITVMFESAQAFEHVDEIAAMDGIDALTLGPQDLAQDLGVFGTPDQNRVLDEKRMQIVEAAKKYGKTCAMLVSSAEQARQWRDAGVLIVNYSTDVAVLMEGYRAAMNEIRA
ncbi:MAG: aldolase/citrate lyase family protein [Chloroflexi bacterium]|nr:aldolase/citrate lyase family protein [Chloroflexota bacterium]